MEAAAFLPDIRRLRSQGFGKRTIGRQLGISKDQAQRLIKKAELEDVRQYASTIGPRTAPALYDAACRALAEARTLIEVKEIGDKAMALKEYGRLARDRALEIDAAELRIRAERKLGEMLAATERNPGSRNLGGSKSEPPAATLAEIGIDKKLSMRAQKLASISERAIEARIANWREQARHDNRVSVNILKGGPINGARAVMGSRQEPDDSLDFFPTPPWATRALCEHVWKRFGWERPSPELTVWEPACGEGHMSEVLREYFSKVAATDIHCYGDAQDCYNFLNVPEAAYDWIITNPPFSGSTDRALEFTLHALDLARIGVAMFVRTQWAVEGIERYERLFRDRPPTLFAPFVERVNLCKGRWDPDGGTATAYCWLVWIKGREQLPPMWIPPGCRKELTRPDDRARFAAWSIVDE